MADGIKPNVPAVTSTHVSEGATPSSAPVVLISASKTDKSSPVQGEKPSKVKGNTTASILLSGIGGALRTTVSFFKQVSGIKRAQEYFTGRKSMPQPETSGVGRTEYGTDKARKALVIELNRQLSGLQENLIENKEKFTKYLEQKIRVCEQSSENIQDVNIKGDFERLKQKFEKLLTEVKPVPSSESEIERKHDEAFEEVESHSVAHSEELVGKDELAFFDEDLAVLDAAMREFDKALGETAIAHKVEPLNSVVSALMAYENVAEGTGLPLEVVEATQKALEENKGNVEKTTQVLVESGNVNYNIIISKEKVVVEICREGKSFDTGSFNVVNQAKIIDAAVFLGIEGDFGKECITRRPKPESKTLNEAPEIEYEDRGSCVYCDEVEPSQLDQIIDQMDIRGEKDPLQKKMELNDREINLTMQFQGPGVVQVYSVVDMGAKERMMVQEFARHSITVDGAPQTFSTLSGFRTLYVDHVNGKVQLTVEDRKKYFNALDYALEGLERIHAAGFIHRDLKPANILVTTEGKGALADFGGAVQSNSDDPEAKVLTGTSAYMSPQSVLARDHARSLDDAVLEARDAGDTKKYTELLNRVGKLVEEAEDIINKLDEKHDVWALGVILLDLGLVSKEDFPIQELLFLVDSSLSDEQVFEKLQDVVKDSSILDAVKEPEQNTLAHLCWRCLRYNPADRPTTKEFRAEYRQIIESTFSK